MNSRWKEPSEIGLSPFTGALNSSQKQQKGKKNPDPILPSSQCEIVDCVPPKKAKLRHVIG
jgi:hypothetical protein